MNWLFLVVLLVVAFCMARGYRRGLLRIVYSMVSWIIIFVLVSWATPFINQYIRNNTSVYAAIAKNVEDKLQQAAKDEIAFDTSDHTKQLESIGISLPAPLMEQMVSFTTDTTDRMIEGSGIYEQIASGVADYAVKGISSLAAWVFASLVVTIISQLLGIVSKIPIVRGVNRYLGVAAGLLYGLMLVWTVFCIVALCGGSEFGTYMIAHISENRLLSLLYESNPVLAVLSRFL